MHSWRGRCSERAGKSAGNWGGRAVEEERYAGRSAVEGARDLMSARDARYEDTSEWSNALLPCSTRINQREAGLRKDGKKEDQRVKMVASTVASWSQALAEADRRLGLAGGGARERVEGRRAATK